MGSEDEKFVDCFTIIRPRCSSMFVETAKVILSAVTSL